MLAGPELNIESVYSSENDSSFVVNDKPKKDEVDDDLEIYVDDCSLTQPILMTTFRH